MAEEKQLTVAEILARARQDNPEAAEPKKRRRRRSVEEGGITVAELTGSFKAVDAAPAQSRHSSVPLEDPNDPKLAALQEQEQDEQVSTEAQPEEVAPVEPAEPDQPAAEEELARDELAEEIPAEEAKEEQEESFEPLPSEEDTGVIQKVGEDAAAPEQSESAQETEDTEYEVPESEATGVMPAVTDSDSFGTSSSATAFGLETTQTPDESFEEPAAAAVDYQDFQEDEEEGTSVWALIGLVVLGVILGIVIFLGFQFLWARLAAWAVAIAAVVVTVAMVFGVKALRTSSDGMSMTLAGIVGLVVTFGPAALYYL